MEKGPQIRVIGNANAEQKEIEKKKIIQLLFGHFESLDTDEREQLEKFEYPKSEKELACIDFANRETGELMKEAGVEPYDIPVENYHIVPPGLYEKAGGGGSGTAFTTMQGMIFNADHLRGNAVAFGDVAVHETLHIKGHLSVEVIDIEGKIDTRHYRRGVRIASSQRYDDSGKYHEHFRGLDEAIVATQEKKSLAKLLELPELLEEKEWLLSDKANELRKELSQKEEIPMEDFIWIDEKNKDGWKSLGYPQQRAVLGYVCGEIQKQFSEQYQSKDGVFKEFLKSHFTGQLLPIARLVEKTFGEGSFRLLGNMASNESSSGVMTFESLKKARARQLRS